MRKHFDWASALALAGSLCFLPLANAAVVNFDEFLPGVSTPMIPTGYANLQWNNFGVLDGWIRKSTEGYHIATISPNNVAFNSYGNSATISSANQFNLISAYLTAAWLNRLEVTVLGYSGTNLTQSGTYVVSNSVPAQINFNYSGVTSVRFVSSPTSQFALDNLTVSGSGLTNSPPHTNSPGGTVALGIVQVADLGHTFWIPPPFLPPGRPKVVNDFLIDQDHSSGGGASLPVVSIDWETNTHFRLTVAAPTGMKFLITPPAGNSVRFAGFLLWNSTGSGTCFYGDVTASFTGLEGMPPDFTESDSVLSHTDGYFGWFDVDSTAVSNSLAFTSMTITGIGNSWHTGLGTQVFTPHAESQLAVYYYTSQQTDSGPCLSIVPLAQPLPAPVSPPPITLEAQPNGDLMITFGGTLQSADNPDGPFQDVAENPQLTYTISQADLGRQQFFRAKAN